MITLPLTHALRQALDATGDTRMVDDLIYLECWERVPLPGSAAALRILQLRRANPQLAADIRAEISRPEPPAR